MYKFIATIQLSAGGVCNGLVVSCHTGFDRLGIGGG